MLREAVAAALGDAEARARLGAARERFLAREAHGADGGATRRVVDLMLELVAAPAENTP